jgi:hypothetical protein
MLPYVLVPIFFVTFLQIFNETQQGHGSHTLLQNLEDAVAAAGKRGKRRLGHMKKRADKARARMEYRLLTGNTDTGGYTTPSSDDDDNDSNGEHGGGGIYSSEDDDDDGDEANLVVVEGRLLRGKIAKRAMKVLKVTKGADVKLFDAERHHKKWGGGGRGSNSPSRRSGKHDVPTGPDGGSPRRRASIKVSASASGKVHTRSPSPLPQVARAAANPASPAGASSSSSRSTPRRPSYSQVRERDRPLALDMDDM